MSAMRAPTHRHRTPVVVNLAWLTLAIGVAAALFLGSTGPGLQIGLWGYTACYRMMVFAAYTGLLTAVVAIVLVPFALIFLQGRAFVGIALSIVIGMITAIVPWHLSRTMNAAQGITDVTTDTASPPPFVAVLRVQDAGARARSEYPGQKLAVMQRQAFPDIEPVRLSVPPIEAFALAHGIAVGMGFRVVAASSSVGVIEAYDRSQWYGLTDDIVIRVKADGLGSRVDIRSRSRNDGEDFGKNAERVRSYIRALRG